MKRVSVRSGLPRALAGLSVLVLFGMLEPRSAVAQETGTVQGTVTQAADGSPLRGILVSVQGSGIAGVTDASGRYTLSRVPAGSQVIIVRWLGYRPRQDGVTVIANQSVTLDVALETQPVALSEVVVEGVSRAPERVVEAPAAVSVVEPTVARDLAVTGQAPLAVAKLPGADVVQSGVNDFNVNARGFNSSLNRRVLVLQDGRDLALAFLGSQEWPALSASLDDLGRIEMVRGPGSALYGANAFSGVLNIQTPTAREMVGTKLLLAGGELSTFRGDLRHAGVSPDGRFGYKFSAGYNRSDTWTRAFSVEGGAARVENEVFVTGIGRVQVNKALRPWARAEWAAPRFNVMAWWSGRNTLDPQLSLNAGIPLEETSHIIHGEAQVNQVFAEGRARVVVGGSARAYLVDTEATLMRPQDDDRNDAYYSGYAQFEVEATPQVKFVAAGRVDDGDLIETQFSPKGAVVITPTPDHSIRLTVNRAFQTPNYSEFFLRVPAGQPTANPAVLEQSIEGYYAAVKGALGPAVDPLGLPDDLAWNFAAQTPILGLGNANLNVEHVTGWEVGYKGSLTDRVFLTLDVYFNRLSDFVTDLLPGVNQQQYPTFDLAATDDVPADLAALDAALAGLGLPPNHPLRAPIPQLLGGYNALLAATGPALTTFDGTRAIVVSYANAGDADEYGVELGLGLQLTNEVRFDANYNFFEFDVDATSVVSGDRVVPNTPKHKVNLALAYSGSQGFDFRVSAQFVEGYEWATGIFFGPIPSRQTVDLSVGYQVNPYVRIHALAVNVFDQERYQMYGGSVIGRRILGGITATY